MKRGILFFALIALISASGFVYADETPAVKTNAPAVKKDTTPAKKDTVLVDTADMRYQKSPLNKLGRGLLNVVTSPNEIPAGVFRVSRDKGDFVGLTLGSVEGFCTFLVRGAVGLYDSITFVIPPYNKPIMEPEYAFQSLEDSFHDYQGGGFNN